MNDIAVIRYLVACDETDRSVRYHQRRDPGHRPRVIPENEDLQAAFSTETLPPGIEPLMREEWAVLAGAREKPIPVFLDFDKPLVGHDPLYMHE